jgi:hypothetical protein
LQGADCVILGIILGAVGTVIVVVAIVLRWFLRNTMVGVMLGGRFWQRHPVGRKYWFRIANVAADAIIEAVNRGAPISDGQAAIEQQHFSRITRSGFNRLPHATALAQKKGQHQEARSASGALVMMPDIDRPRTELHVHKHGRRANEKPKGERLSAREIVGHADAAERKAGYAKEKQQSEQRLFLRIHVSALPDFASQFKAYLV